MRNEIGAIGKESMMQIGLVGAILAAAIATATWAGRMINIVERTSADIAEIKATQKEMWVLQRSMITDVTGHEFRITALEKEWGKDR